MLLGHINKHVAGLTTFFLLLINLNFSNGSYS